MSLAARRTQMSHSGAPLPRVDVSTGSYNLAQAESRSAPKKKGARDAGALFRCFVASDYPRPTTMLTGKPRRLIEPGRGDWPMTRPRSCRLERALRTLPTEQ